MAKQEKTGNGTIVLANTVKIIGVVFLVGSAVIALTVSQTKSREAVKHSIVDLQKDVVKTRKIVQIETNRAHADIRKYINTRTTDRWRKKNDQLFMEQYSRENNLKMPPHKRVIE